MSDRAGKLAPIRRVIQATKSDTVDIVDLGFGPTRAILVEDASVTVSAVTVNMEAVGTNIALILGVGVWHPLAVTRIYSTGTDADTIWLGW